MIELYGATKLPGDGFTKNPLGEIMKTIFIALGMLLSTSLMATKAQECPPEFTDTGAYCIKPTYGRGAGSNLPTCEAEFGANNCEKCLLLYYPKCKASYKPSGCNICSHECPPNMTDLGVSCQKQS